MTSPNSTLRDLGSVNDDRVHEVNMKRIIKCSLITKNNNRDSNVTG